MFSLDTRLLEVALLTIVIEVPVFYLCGYMAIKQLAAFALVNLVSNLLLNEALPIYTPTFSYWLTLAVGEALVVVLEFVLMLHIIEVQKYKLFKSICLTNIISIILGLILLYKF